MKDESYKTRYEGLRIIPRARELNTRIEEKLRMYEKSLGVKLRPLTCQDLDALGL